MIRSQKSRVGHSVLFRSVHYVLFRSKKRMFLGGVVAAAAATAVEKRVSIFRVIKINLSFGALKIFQMVQKVNNTQLMSFEKSSKGGPQKLPF